MKSLLLITLLVGSAAHAGPTRFDSSEFNKMIAESQAAEKDLRKELRQNAGFRQADRRRQQIKEVTLSETSVVNVPTTMFKDKKKGKSVGNGLETQDFNRLSQEMNETY